MIILKCSLEGIYFGFDVIHVGLLGAVGSNQSMGCYQRFIERVGLLFHTGIGSDEMMCRVILRLLVDTFKMSRLESATEFMDAIRDSFLDILKDYDKTDYWDDECQMLEESDGEQE